MDPPEKEEDEGPLGKYCLTAQLKIFAFVWTDQFRQFIRQNKFGRTVKRSCYSWQCCSIREAPCRNFSNFFPKTTISVISVHILVWVSMREMWIEISDIVVFRKKLQKFLQGVKGPCEKPFTTSGKRNSNTVTTFSRNIFRANEKFCTARTLHIPSILHGAMVF